MIAEEIGLVIKQSLDDFSGETLFPRMFEQADQLIQVADPALSKDRCEGGRKAPQTRFGQFLAGARCQQFGNDPVRSVGQRHACAPAAATTFIASSSGGEIAQAMPLSETARGIPQTAQLS